MIAKTFEVRDRATFIPVLAVQLEPSNASDRYLLSRAGYGLAASQQAKYVQMIKINGGSGESHCDPYEWGGRTYPTAHQYIIENFDELESGSVVDVEHILGETTQRKESEQHA